MSVRVRDPWLLCLGILATIIGLFFIYDAGYARSIQNSGSAVPVEFSGQIKYSVAALLAWLAGTLIPGRAWLRFSGLVWLTALVGLVSVERFGTVFNGARRWIELGPVNVQPAEFAKLGAVIYLAGYFATRKGAAVTTTKVRNWASYLDHVFLPTLRRLMPAFWVALGVFLIESEPDLGTAAIVAVAAYLMFVAGGVRKRWLLIGVVSALAGGYLMVLKQPYRWDRVANHLERWTAANVDDKAYQTVQAELAMATGGVIGVGAASGVAKHRIPAPTTDFVMATVAEEFGLVGAAVVIGLLGGLVFRLLQLAARAPSRFAALTLTGIAGWIGVQSAVNVMMANGFLPAIGIPLPFISSGGSSLVALWLALGVANSVLQPMSEPAKEEPDAPDRHGWRNRRARLSGA